MSTTRTTEPTIITQGESLEWTRSLTDYPASEWTLSYRFRGQNGPGLNVTASADGDDYAVTVAASDTAKLAAGRFDWQAWVTEIADTDNVQMVRSGRVTVKVGFGETTPTVDLRTPAKIALDSIDAALLAFASSDVLEYEISTPAGVRRVKRSDKVNLMTMRREFALIVSVEQTKERLENGGSLMRRVGIVVRET